MNAEPVRTRPTSSSSGGSRRATRAFRSRWSSATTRAVYSLAYGVLRNAEDAEEATQDAFLTLYRKIGTFDESKKFFSWFYRVALNAAYSRARRRQPAAKTVALEDYLPRFQGDGHQASPGLRRLERSGSRTRRSPGTWRSGRRSSSRSCRRPTGT